MSNQPIYSKAISSTPGGTLLTYDSVGIVDPNAAPESIVGQSWDRAFLYSNVNLPFNPVAVVYIDPVGGNDSNSGLSSSSPKKTLVTSGWGGGVTSFYPGMVVLFKRGTTYVHPAGQGNLLVGSGRGIGAWGDPSLPYPVLRITDTGQSAVVYGYQASNTWISDIDVDASTVPNTRCIWIPSDPAVSVTNVLLANINARGVNGNTTSLGAVTVGTGSVNSTNTEYPNFQDIILKNVVASNNGGHGIHVIASTGYLDSASGRYVGIWLDGCRAVGNGTVYDSHNISMFSNGVKRDWSTSAWVAVSGNVYYTDFSAIIGRSVPRLDLTWAGSNTDPFQLLLEKAATAINPGLNEIGFDPSNQRLYINLGRAPTNLDIFQSCVKLSRGIIVNDCYSEGCKLAGITGVAEGHGFAFDDFVSESTIANSISRKNKGLGVSMNLGINNWVINNHLTNNNTLCPIQGYGLGHLISRNRMSGSGLVSSSGSAGPSMVTLFSPKTYTGASLFGSKVTENLMQYTGTNPAANAVTNTPSTAGKATMFVNNRTNIRTVGGCVIEAANSPLAGRYLAPSRATI